MGIFLGFATHEGVYGSQILTSNHSIVTAKYQVAYDNDLMPLVSSDASNPRMRPLLQLLGRGPTHLKSQGFASNSDYPEGSSETEPNLPLFSTSEEQDQSSDDEYVEQILSMPEKFANIPPFNILDPDTVQRPYTLPVQLSDQSNQNSGQELDTDSGESSSPPPRH